MKKASAVVTLDLETLKASAVVTLDLETMMKKASAVVTWETLLTSFLLAGVDKVLTDVATDIFWDLGAFYTS